jgi:gas vesicle protein
MFALGTTAGAVVALLTAPRSGKETRRRLQDAMQQVREKAGNASASVADSYTRGAEAIKEGFSKAFDKDTNHQGAAQEASRQATGSASKSESHYNPTSPTRAGAYGVNTPK